MLKVSPHSSLHRLCVRTERQVKIKVKSTLCVAFQSMMVAKAKEELEQEMEEKEEEKAKYLEEKTPAVQTSGMSLAELQVSFYIYHRVFHICKLKLCTFSMLTHR